MRTILAVLALCPALFMAACKSSGKTRSGNTSAAEEQPTGGIKPLKPSNYSKLEGHWVLNYISGPRIAFEGLYPDRKPDIRFDLQKKQVSGQNSCNSYNGPLNADDVHIRFNEPMMMTKMACPGEGESVFMKTLETVTSYTIENDTILHFISGDVAVMRFSKQ